MSAEPLTFELALQILREDNPRAGEDVLRIYTAALRDFAAAGEGEGEGGPKAPWLAQSMRHPARAAAVSYSAWSSFAMRSPTGLKSSLM